MVFLGTVTDALEYHNEYVTRARMRIDKAYKGIREKTVVLYDDGMCDGPTLQVGEQYLMYTGRLRDGDIPSRGCTRSRHAKYAEEDLLFLNHLDTAAPTSTIFGQVVSRSDDYNGTSQPAVSATVEVTGPSGKLTTKTDAEGRYKFNELPPAEYTIAANQPGFGMTWFQFNDKPPTAKVEARGCALADIVLRKNWQSSVGGGVFKSNGAPGPRGIDLVLIRIENRNGKEDRNPMFGRGVRTDEDGQFSFTEVQPGRYNIVMNMYRFPTERLPYPTIYWPGARSESEAVIIEVADAVEQPRYDFTLPPEPKSKVIKGVLLSAAGEPIAGAGVLVQVPPDNTIANDNENRLTTDESGSFSFVALEGFEYRVSAMGVGSDWRQSAEVSFTVQKDLPPLIRLVLKAR
jgi:hypothetical protein